MIQLQRPRRLRQNSSIRNMVKETYLGLEHLIYPVFFHAKKHSEDLKALPDLKRHSPTDLYRHVEECCELGLNNFALFPAIDEALKNPQAKEALNPENLNLTVIGELKRRFPHITLMGDVALDPYSSLGHDGLVDEKNGEILNDQTVAMLAKMSLLQAQAGIDILGPSDMMDGRVGEIRQALERAGYSKTLIMSYTAKYASACYGPFREALNSAPKSGDKKTYQMDPANIEEALREASLDEAEGADFLMVKPGLLYLDVVRALHQHSRLPIAVYNVSGEYAMVKEAIGKGSLSFSVIEELLFSFRRAGAQVILTYHAKEYADWLKTR